MDARNLDGNLESWMPRNKEGKRYRPICTDDQESKTDKKLKKLHEAYQLNKRIKDSIQLKKNHTRKKEICKLGANPEDKKCS